VRLRILFSGIVLYDTVVVTAKETKEERLIESWGKYPPCESSRRICLSDTTIRHEMLQAPEVIPFGNGRSYGDSALSDTGVALSKVSQMIDFDPEKGVLKVSSDILLSQVIEHCIPLGWFLAVTPGTKEITVGGAIASDVHGKGHYQSGCFSAYVKTFSLLLPDGEILQCSPTENVDYFVATCGGMGLTGVILDAELSLKRISSQHIHQKTLKVQGIAELLDTFEQNLESPYAVAWLNCVEPKRVGQGIVTLGHFCDDQDLNYRPQGKRALPTLPYHWFLQKPLIRIFNWLYFHKRRHLSEHKVDIDTFFYPLDAVANWNVLYGTRGMIQYQFVVPLEESQKALAEVLREVAESDFSANLAVLKRHGPANANWLSFPLEGYSLALDFKYSHKLLEFLEYLDTIVLRYRGRFYLAKDARVRQGVFERGYPMVAKFRDFRDSKGLRTRFNSLQSKRLML